MSGQTAGFRINFRSGILGKTSKVISYILNEKHKFKFMIKADVVPVSLKLSHKRIDIKFSDDNLDMAASEVVKVTNKGNANARFSWYSPSTSFSFVPDVAIVKPGTSLPVRVFFKPNGIKSLEDEILDLRVEDGNPEYLSVTGTTVETKCEITPNQLNFGAMAVGEEIEHVLTIHNVHAKNSAIFMIDPETVDPCLNINKFRGKIYPQSKEKLKVTFSSDHANKFTGISIIVNIRGSNPIKVPISAEVIIPQIDIFQKEFDFKEITYGGSGVLQMIIENSSPIQAKLKLDLRPKEEFKENGVECLKVEQIRENDEVSYIMHGLENEYLKILERKNKDMKYGAMDLESTSGDEGSDKNNSNFDGGRSFTGSMGSLNEDSLNLDVDMDAINFYELILKPKKIYNFQLTFTPQNTKNYEFRLPLTMGNSSKFNPKL
jgi:hypothetical protein